MTTADAPPSLCAIESERQILGLLLRPEDIYQKQFHRAQTLVPDDFWPKNHCAIWAEMLRLHEETGGISVLPLLHRLRARGDGEYLGSYLADLADDGVELVGLDWHVKHIRDLAQKRRLKNLGQWLFEEAVVSTASADDMQEEAEHRVMELGAAPGMSPAKSCNDLIHTFLARLDHPSRGLSTGYIDLDDLTGGLHPGELTLLAARPSMGKSTLALNIAQNVANQNRQVGFLSLEVSGDQLVSNLVCGKARIDSRIIRRGDVRGDTAKNLMTAANALYSSKGAIWFDEESNLTIGAAKGKARRLKQRHRIELLVIDYLQLMTVGGKPESRQMEISAISRGLKGIARELHIPVLALSQLNRDLEKRTDKRPALSDLRESGSLEQDADVVLLLHRADYFQQTDDNKGKASVQVAKQRNGPTGQLTLLFNGAHMRFENYAGPREPVYDAPKRKDLE